MNHLVAATNNHQMGEIMNQITPFGNPAHTQEVAA